MLKLILTFSFIFSALVAGPTAPIRVVHTQDVSEMIAAGKPVVIIDARSIPYDDLNRIPGAKLLPYNSPEKEIREALPSPNALIVVYCTSPKCPASNYLAERLVRLGYKNVSKYPEGISSWMAAGNKIEIDERSQKSS